MRLSNYFIRETSLFDKDRTGKVGIEKNFIKIEVGKKGIICRFWDASEVKQKIVLEYHGFKKLIYNRSNYVEGGVNKLT